jgi:hypothetical protein
MPAAEATTAILNDKAGILPSDSHPTFSSVSFSLCKKTKDFRPNTELEGLPLQI